MNSTQENDERPDVLEDGTTSEPVQQTRTEVPVETATEQDILNELKEAEAEVQLAQREFDEAKAVLVAARAKRDAVRHKEGRWRKSRPANSHIVAYLESQNAARMERAMKMNALREAGIDLRALGKSPLDAAIAQRKRAEGAPSRTPKPVVKSAGLKG